MTFLRSIEHAGARRRVTWLTLLGALLLPVVIGGILVAALYDPTERLDAVPAAIVNDDEPVTLDGQLVPLGRQLTAGLVEGSDEVPSNLDWTITNDEDAAAGLADGTYAAVVTIPANFSAAATSTAPGSTPEQATISVTTPPDSLVVDDAISAQVTQAAASLTGTTLSRTYLENVFLGFTTLGDQLGTAAEGAGDLADGARSAADGATALSDGVGQVASGADALADGAAQLTGGASQLAGGAARLDDGATQLADGATRAAAGVDTLAGGVRTTADQSRQLAQALTQTADRIPADTPRVPDDLVDAAQRLSANSDAINSALADGARELRRLADLCTAQGGTSELCTPLQDAAADAEAEVGTAQSLVTNAGGLATGLQELSTQLPALRLGLQELASGATRLSTGLDQLATGADTAAGGVRQLSTGADALSSGAGALSTGASQLASGAGELSGGASQLADGADTAATGASDLGDGVGRLADGSRTLADGLTRATESLPSYTDEQAASLASVVADPVAAEGIGANLFGATAVPLLAAVALWFGGLGTFVALRAVTERTVASRRPSALLALRSLAPAAAIGAVQGLLVAAVVQLAAGYDWGDWSLFAAVAVAAGLAFSVVHQALVAVFGGAGRWVAALVGVLAVATGIVSTVPGVLASIAALMPTAPAYQGMVAALTSADGLGAALAGLVIWSVLAFLATTLAVARRRTVSSRELLAASAA